MLSIQNGLLNRPWVRYGLTVIMVAVAFLLHQVLTTHGAAGLPTYITFYPAVMLVAIVAGFWPGFVATAMVALAVDYWILLPQGFGIRSLTDAVGLMFFSGMGVFMSVVAEFYRRVRLRAQESSLQLTRANEALRDLSSKVLSAQENERRRVALEIHDTIGSCLNTVKFEAENVMLHIGDADSGATEPLKTLVSLVQECMEECRRIQMDLRPSTLDDLGLLPTLSWLCRNFQTVYSTIRVEQEIEIEEDDVPPPLKIVAFRIIQEAMNNTAKHSHADLVRLSLRKVDDKIELVLQDNGQGFNLEKVVSQENTKKGLGLSSMKERTELSGGSFAIDSAIGKGTLIRASWSIQTVFR